MSKGKAAKGKPGLKETLSWEVGIPSEEIDEEGWKACVILASPATLEDEYSVQLLVNGIRSNQRKLVKVVTREELLLQV